MANPYSTPRPKCINEYETWYKVAMDNWSKFYIREYEDGSATKTLARGPFNEKEYFRLLLAGDV